MTPREIKFEDIRVGDDIEAHFHESDVFATARGVVGEIDGNMLRTAKGGPIANVGGYDWKFYLHSRPTPEEPKGLGAVVHARAAHPADVPHLVRTLVRTANHEFPWVDGRGNEWEWSDFDPDSIEVLSEGIEVPRGSEVTS